MARSTSTRSVDLLSADERAGLEALGTEVTYPPGQAIFREGQPSHSVLLVRSGHVKVTRLATDGTNVVLAIRGVNELLGDEGVLMDEPRSATMTTITSVVGLDIAAADLFTFVENNRLWQQMYRAAVVRRRQSDQRLLDSRHDVRTRLARVLVRHASEIGKADGEALVMESTLSQQDLATEAGASRDAVAIELRKLRAEGVLSTARGRIVLHDLTALQDILPAE